MRIDEEKNAAVRAHPVRRYLMEGGIFALGATLAVVSAITMKSSGATPLPLTMIERSAAAQAPSIEPISIEGMTTESVEDDATEAEAEITIEEIEPTDLSVRWFNGKMVRPAKVLRMKVTAYSPDAQSCGEFADGITATLHHVTTNGGALVAADPKVLPYGSMISVPGYDEGRVVPVLDCGGKIKGARLDVLYPTHSRARAWGVQNLDVIVWEYADGSANDNPRALR